VVNSHFGLRLAWDETVTRFSFLLLLLSIALKCWAQSPEQMSFRAQPPQKELVPIVGDAWTIYADGVIDADASLRLTQLIKQNGIPDRSYLVINSPGGNLFGGIKLGKAIRSAYLLTYVGRAASDSLKLAAGECYSACALAFLGGEYRYMVDGSIYGVHRFYFIKSNDQDTDAAQVVSAAVVQYMRDMDIDPTLFTEMTKVGQTEINILSKDDLSRLDGPLRADRSSPRQAADECGIP
jgi:hypothetical protein